MLIFILAPKKGNKKNWRKPRCSKWMSKNLKTLKVKLYFFVKNVDKRIIYQDIDVW